MGEAGVRIDLTPGSRQLDGGHVLLGGSPTTVLRLSKPFDGAHSSTLLGQRMLATGIGSPCLEGVPQPAADRLTVIVPVHERPAMLDACLASLSPLEVIVVDDGSCQADAIAAVTRRHGATLVRLPVNRGPAAARNAGLAAVRTPLVAFVDSDVTVEANTLLQVARHLGDPSVSIAAPRVRSASSTSRPWFERYESALGSLDLGASSAEVRPGTNVAYVPSACLIAQVADLGAGFDPGLRVGEDVDLCWRLIETGHRIRYDADSVAHHQARTTVSGWLGRKVAYGSSAAPLAERHGSLVAPAALAPLPTMAATLTLIRSRWAVPAVVASLVECAQRAHAATGQGLEPSLTVPRLAAGSLITASRQLSALVVRHWWPAAAAVLASSRRPAVRNLAINALVVDSVAAVLNCHRQRRPADSPLEVPALVAGRLLDNVAYGAGLWRGALAARSARALMPRIVRRRRT